MTANSTKLGLAGLLILALLGSSAVSAEGIPLHEAAKNNLHKTIGKLIADGADVDAQDALGYTALHWAVHHKANESVSALLRSMANPMLMNLDREIPIEMEAAQDLFSLQLHALQVAMIYAYGYSERYTKECLAHRDTFRFPATRESGQ